MEFEWDPDKNKMNLLKHKVSFEEASETFYDPNGIEMDDKIHSTTELRYLWIGKTTSGRILTTWFTIRDDRIRIIGSAEWRRLRRLYETTQVK